MLVSKQLPLLNSAFSARAQRVQARPTQPARAPLVCAAQPEQQQLQQQQSEEPGPPVMDHKRRLLKTLSLSEIRRPLGGTRKNDQSKVEALANSIQEIGLQEPIDVLQLDTDGSYWGFSGCHRFEAHQRLGLETIKCRVRKATPQTLKMHMM